MSTTKGWFGGAEPRTSGEARFLAVLRDRGERWRAAGLVPSRTSAMTSIVPLYLQVDVPGLPAEHVNLQVGYWEAEPHRMGVQGEWGDRYVLDSAGVGGLRAFGLSAEPEELAETAARWLDAQLAGPVDRQEWLGSSGHVVGRRWTFASTGAVIGQAGRQPRRRPADRVVRVR